MVGKNVPEIFFARVGEKALAVIIGGFVKTAVVDNSYWLLWRWFNITAAKEKIYRRCSKTAAESQKICSANKFEGKDLISPLFIQYLIII